MVVAELQAFGEAKDFKVWLSSRDQSAPPLGLAPGGEQGQHAALGHDLITFKQFCSPRCVTVCNERMLFATVVECVKACHDPLYHEKNPEFGSWLFRKMGLPLSSDDTYKIGYGGDDGNWELTALCVTTVNLSNYTSDGKAHGVTNRPLPLMFRYQKRSTTDSLVEMVAALQFAVYELAHLPADHPSGLGHLLKSEWDTIHSAEQKDIARNFIKKATKFIYYSSTGEEREWLWELVFMASALTHNTAIGAWFQEQYQQPPWSCWQHTAHAIVET